ncbi:MAG: hypothetical protein JWQ71_2659, partial [Pedosphaera sp.]|nr:hypothetical protein [Pedosphaera sp.]
MRKFVVGSKQMSDNENRSTILYVDDDDNDVLLLKHAFRCAKLPLDLQV